MNALIGSETIEQLEDDYWQNTDYPTELVKKCHDYRKIPLNNLNVEQVRLLIGQKIGIQYLLPIAIDQLNDNILAEGDYYAGDLLSNVLELSDEDWKGNELAKEKLKEMVATNISLIESEEDKQLLKKARLFLQTK